MLYQFEIDNFDYDRKKVSLQESRDLKAYFAETVVEAPDEMRAYRILARMVAGRLSKESCEGHAIIALPEYGKSVLELHATARA